MMSIIVLSGLIILSPGHGNADVDTLWTRTYPYTTGGAWMWGGGPSVQQTLDGGFIVATEDGSGSGNVQVVKTDDLGEVLWAKSYSLGPYLTRGISIRQLRDGDYVMCAGRSGPFGSYSGRLMRLDAEGEAIWAKSVGGVNKCIQQTIDDGFIIAGYHWVDTGGEWPILVKTDSDGDVEWEEQWFGGSFNHIVELRDGSGYALVGQNYHGVYFVRTNPDGVEVTNRTYEGGDWGSEICETSDGGFIMCGQSDDDAYLIRTGAAGDTLWTKKYRDLPRMLRVADITDPALPSLVGSVDAQGDASSVSVEGHFAYVTTGRNGAGGLHVIDVSDPDAPVHKASLVMPDNAHDVAVVDDQACVAWGVCGPGPGCVGGLLVVDASDPTSPAIIGNVEMSSSMAARGVAVAGDYAYVAMAARTVNEGALEVVDISDPTAPGSVGEVELQSGEAVAVAGDHAYVIGGFWLEVVDISIPASPEFVGIMHTVSSALDIAVAGDSAYVAVMDGLLVVDISDPTSPEIVATVETPRLAQGVAVSGDFAYVAAEEGLEVIDLSMETPEIVGRVSTPGLACAVTVTGGHAYVAERSTPAVAQSVLETSHGTFLAAGQGLDRVWLYETDTIGDTLWSESYDIVADAEYARRIRPTSDGGYIIAGGGTPHPDQPYSLFLMRLEETVTSVSPPVAETPSAVDLRPNVPNPFNQTTTIRYYVPEPGDVLLRIYDPRGRLVRTLVRTPRTTGTHTIRWDGTNKAGAPVAGGVYFYRLNVDGEMQTRRMILAR
jgi:hypothetical protein